MAAADVLAFAFRDTTYCWPPTRYSTLTRRTAGLDEDRGHSCDNALLNLRLGLIAEAWTNLRSASVSSLLLMSSTLR